MKARHYYIVVNGGVDPSVYGSFPNEAARDADAMKTYNNRAEFRSEYDSIFKACIDSDGELLVGVFLNGELGDD